VGVRGEHVGGTGGGRKRSEGHRDDGQSTPRRNERRSVDHQGSRLTPSVGPRVYAQNVSEFPYGSRTSNKTSCRSCAASVAGTG
jgi:hypothetical protein